MNLTITEDDKIVEIDYIFLVRRLVEAEDCHDIELEQFIHTLFLGIKEYSEEHKHMPYGPTMKIFDIKKRFPGFVNSCSSFFRKEEMGQRI